MAAMTPSPAVTHGRQACSALLRELLGALAPPAPAEPPQPPAPPALTGGANTLLLIDRQFEAWPLDEPVVLAALAAWFRRPGRRLTLVGLDFEALARVHPRFSRWRRDWGHCIEVLSPVDGALALRGLLAARVAAQWLDAPDWRLRLITDPVHLGALHEQSADFLQRCEPAWPLTTLGL